jgi:putative hydrolase of the HAD superfamily
VKKGIKLVLKTLKSKGLKIGLISNSVHSGNEKKQWLRRMGLLKYFDFIFSSSDLGFTKVYPECLKKVLKITGFEPNQAILVGHQYKDFLGARLIGMKTLSINKVSADYEVSNLSEIPEAISKLIPA